MWDYLAAKLRDAGTALETAAKELKQAAKKDSFSNEPDPQAPDAQFGPPTSLASHLYGKKTDEAPAPNMTFEQKMDATLDLGLKQSRETTDSFSELSENFLNGKKGSATLDENRRKILHDDVRVIKEKVEGIIKEIEDLKTSGLQENLAKILDLTEELNKYLETLAVAERMLSATLPAMQKLGWSELFFEVAFSRLVHSVAAEINENSEAPDVATCQKEAAILMSYVEKGELFASISEQINAGALSKFQAAEMWKTCKGGAEGFCEALATSEDMGSQQMGAHLKEFFQFQPEGRGARAVGAMAVGLGLALDPFDGELWAAREHIEESGAVVSPWASENGSAPDADPFALRDPRNKVMTACDESASACELEDDSPFGRLEKHIAWIEEKFPTQDADAVNRLKATMDREAKIQMFEDAIAEVSDGAVIGGERVVPSTLKLRLCVTEESFQTEMLKLQNDIALVTFMKGIEELEKASDEILVAIPDEPQSDAMTLACAGPQRSGCIIGQQADAARKHKAQYKAKFEALKAKAAEARRLMDLGDVDGAKRAFAEAVNDEAFKKVVEKMQHDLQLTGAVKFTSKIGIIVAASMAAGVVGAKVAASLGVLGVSPALIAVLKFAVGTTVFFLSEKALNLAVLHELPIDLEKSAGENALNLTEDFIKTAGMLLFIEIGMLKYTKFVDKRLFGRAIDRLVAGGKLTADEMAKIESIQLTRAGINSLPKELAEKVFKEAELGIAGKTAYFGGLLTTEYTLFTEWDYIVATYDESKSAGDLSLPDAEKFFTAESMLERLKFLACLKLGSFMASPITKSVLEGAVKEALEKLRPRLEKLEAKNKEILGEMAIYEKSGEQSLAKTREFVGRLGECAKERLEIERLINKIAPGSVDTTGSKRALEFIKEMEAGTKALETISRGEFTARERAGLKKFLEAGRENGSLEFTENADGSFSVKLNGATEAVEVKPSAKKSLADLAEAFIPKEILDAEASLKLWVLENAPAINNWMMENAPMLAIGVDTLFNGGLGGSSGMAGPVTAEGKTKPASDPARKAKQTPANLTGSTEGAAARMFGGIRALLQKLAPAPAPAPVRAADDLSGLMKRNAAARRQQQQNAPTQRPANDGWTEVPGTARRKSPIESWEPSGPPIELTPIERRTPVDTRKPKNVEEAPAQTGKSAQAPKAADARPTEQDGYFINRDLQTSNTFTFKTPMGNMDACIRGRIAEKRARGDMTPVKVLVIGAGQGTTEAQLKKLFGGDVEILAFSKEDEVLPENRSGFAGIKVGDLDIDPLPDIKPDLVISIYGSYHAKNQMSALQKIVDVMPAGTETIVMVPTASPLMRGFTRSTTVPYHLAQLGLKVMFIPIDFTSSVVYLKKTKAGPLDVEVAIKEAVRAGDEYDSLPEGKRAAFAADYKRRTGIELDPTVRINENTFLDSPDNARTVAEELLAEALKGSNLAAHPNIPSNEELVEWVLNELGNHSRTFEEAVDLVLRRVEFNLANSPTIIADPTVVAVAKTASPTKITSEYGAVKPRDATPAGHNTPVLEPFAFTPKTREEQLGASTEGAAMKLIDSLMNLLWPLAPRPEPVRLGPPALLPNESEIPIGPHAEPVRTNGLRPGPAVLGNSQRVSTQDTVRVAPKYHEQRAAAKAKKIADNSGPSRLSPEKEKMMQDLFGSSQPQELLQGGFGNCYLIAYLYPLAQTPRGREQLAGMIRKHGDGWSVKFPGFQKKILVTQDDLAAAVWFEDNGAKVPMLSTGPIGFKVIEVAFAKMRALKNGKMTDPRATIAPVTLKIADGGHTKEVSKAIWGDRAKVRRHDLGLLPYQKIKPLAEFAEHPEKYNIFVDNDNLSINAWLRKHPDWFETGHVYTVMDVDMQNKLVTISNPHDASKPITITFDTFFTMFNRMDVETLL